MICTCIAPRGMVTISWYAANRASVLVLGKNYGEKKALQFYHRLTINKRQKYSTTNLCSNRKYSYFIVCYYMSFNWLKQSTCTKHLHMFGFVQIKYLFCFATSIKITCYTRKSHYYSSTSLCQPDIFSWRMLRPEICHSLFSNQ